MNRDYLIVQYYGNGYVDQIKMNCLKDALVAFREVISTNLNFDVELYRLKEGWTSLDADNVEDTPVFTYDHENDELYVAEAEDVIFAIQDLEEAKKFGHSIKVSKFTSDKETFFFDDYWMDYWEEPVLEIK